MSRVPQSVRDAVVARAAAAYGGDVALCEVCGQQRGTNYHHRRGKGQGGPNSVSNGMWLCGSGTTGCHGYITEHPAAAVRNGWSIKGTQLQPDEVAVRYRDDVVYLLEDGSVMPADWDGEAA